MNAPILVNRAPEGWSFARHEQPKRPGLVTVTNDAIIGAGVSAVLR